MNLRPHFAYAPFIAFAATCSLLAAQEAEQPPAPSPAAATPLTTERVEQLRKEVEDSSELDDESRKKVSEIYRSALNELQRGAELATRAATFKADAEAAKQRVAEVKQQLESLQTTDVPSPDEALLPELEQTVSRLEIELEAQKKALAAAEAEPKLRAQRRKEIRTRLVGIPERIAEITKQMQALPADEHALITTARKTELAARRLVLEREIPELESELAKYDAEDAADLVRLQRDLCTQQVALTGRYLQANKECIKRARAAAAELAVRRARDEAIAAEPVLKSYAERNQYLAELTRTIAESFDLADRELKTTQQDYDQLLRQFEQTCKKVGSVGLTRSIGALLRKQRADLPDIRGRQTAVSLRSNVIDEIQYELFEYDDERQELSNPSLLVQQILSAVAPRGTQDHSLLEAAAHELLERKREYLDALIRNYNQYFDTLVELDTVQRQEIALVEQYHQYIDERVLWIRSGNLLTTEFRFDQADATFLSGHCWSEVTLVLWKDLRRNLPLYAVALICLAGLFVRQRYCRRELWEIGQTVQKPTCRHFRPTFRSLLLTVSISLTWPALLGFLAWRLSDMPAGSLFTKAVGYGLICTCAMWIPLELFRQICRPGGLGESHFDWPASATHLLRKNLRWLIALVLPLMFVTATFFAADSTHGRDAIERTSFILHAFVLSLFIRSVAKPDGGVFQEYIAYHQGGWIDRLKHLWCWLGMAAPLLLAGLAFWGYYYTAQVLSWRLYATVCFAASVVLIRAMLLRLILVRRRKLSIDLARERAMAAEQSSEQPTTISPAGIITEQPHVDLSTHSVQTRRLLTAGTLATSLVGVWLIWVEVLPALSMLDQWPLWTTTTAVQVVDADTNSNSTSLTATETEGSESNVTTRTEYHTTSITFSHVALAVLIAIITFVSARNVPGLLEMSILQRLPLDVSVRYAITTLVSYAIVFVGIVVACSNIGLRWPQIQWLATALTFGLAFGLQELFANFIAGLILLFERPVRVGDVVTVDDVTGVVSRIRIRATSITNWDRKEYVVPNKEFVTGRLLNWTLSDQINRIVINVGIAYGSDTERAREILLETANAHPLTLKDPPSLATFEGFGDNALNFCLRTFLPSMENRLQVIHDLHSAIDQAFRKAGIEIAFPQRDLHIRSVPEMLALTGTHARKAGERRQEAA
jgi:potassium efflux system protein